MIALLFAAIMLAAGFASLTYYHQETGNNDKEIHKLDYYIDKYNFKSVATYNHKNNFTSETPAISGTNVTNNITLNYTIFKGKNNITGQFLKVYVNGKLEHESLLINSTKLNGNITIVPLYSKSGNYNITILSYNAKDNKGEKDPSDVTSDVYVDLQATYSWGSNGWALALTNYMTELLIAVLATGAILTAPTVVIAAILAVGATTIGLYDSWGGDNGVFFFGAHYWWGSYTWINSPYNKVPNDLKDYGSNTLTLYNGDLP